MLLSSPTSAQGEVITLSHFIHLLRELKPGWNPIDFLLRGDQLVASNSLNKADLLNKYMKSNTSLDEQSPSPPSLSSEGVELIEIKEENAGRGDWI